MKNKKKSEQLGMSYGKANGILRKRILFDLVKKLNLDICYRCGKKIENRKDLSIEHKIPWLDSKTPIALFFDVENISFSHLTCNSREGGKNYKIQRKEGHIWCWDCKNYKLIKDFPPRFKKNVVGQCTKCSSKYRAEFRHRTGRR